MKPAETSLYFAGAALGKSAAAVILGCPYEEPTALRKGTSLAPGTIRSISRGLYPHQPGTDGDGSVYRFTDWGDIMVHDRNQREIFAEIEGKTEKIIAENKVPFGIGGSGAVNYPLIKAAKKVFPHCRVLSLDAHTGEAPVEGEITHDNVFSALYRDHILNPGERYRWGQTDPSPGDNPGWEEKPPAVKMGVLGEMHRLYRYPVFVTVDIDVMDPPFAPGSGHPVYGGIATTELFQTLGLLKSLKVIGFSLTEVTPPCDPSGITSILAATIIKKTLQMILTKSRKTIDNGAFGG